VRVSRRVWRGWIAAGVVGAVATAGAAGGSASIRTQDLREWLTYVASDELQGRAVFSAGFGLAAAYISDHLRAWSVKPAGDPGQYLQTVRVLGVKTTSHSTVTVEVNGESKVFADGSGITFPKNMGGNQHLVLRRLEFVGYGLDAPAAGHVDFRNTDVKGAAVVWLGTAKPMYFARFGFTPISKWSLPFGVLVGKFMLVFDQPAGRWIPALAGRHTFMKLGT